MSEARYWSDHVRPALAPFGRLVRVENAADLGTPDVAYCLRTAPGAPAAAGWIELKHLPAAPTRAATPLRIPHLTVDQVRWGEEWTAAGGRCWFLLRAGTEHFLTQPPWPRAIYRGEVTAAALADVAAVYAVGRFPAGRVLKALTADDKGFDFKHRRG